VPNRFSKIHLPRFTGEVRVGFEVTVRMLACEDASALVVRQMHSLKLISADAFNSVMPSQPLVQKREIRVEKIENASILLEDRLKEQFRLFEHGGAKRFVKPREKFRIRRGVFIAAQLQPLPGKILNQGASFAIL